MKKMKKNKYILLIFFALQSLATVSQTKDTTWNLPPGYLIETVRNTYDTISHEGMKTGLLLNRGMVFTDYTEEWYEGNPVIANNVEWVALYNGIKDSDINGILELPPDSIFNDYSTINTFGISTIAIGILDFNVDYLSKNAIGNIMEEPGSEPKYDQFRLFSGALLYDKIYKGSVVFLFTPELHFTNQEKSSKMFVDFEDGMGYRKIDLTTKNLFKVKYKSTGEKSIRFKLTDGTDTFISYSQIMVKDLNIPAPTAKSDPNISSDYFDYYYLEGDDNELDKPVIFVEGFDIEGNSAEDLYEDWKTTQQNLAEKGYDCFFINFKHTGLSVITNAEEGIQKLIKGINEAKINHFDNVILGESMGGLVTRIALKKLEEEGYDHQCRLYVSYDSPHKGANIPPGVQDLVYRVFNILQPYPFQFNIFTDIIGTIFGFISPEYSSVYDKLMSEAAQEMIVNHINGHSEFNDLQDFLMDLGLPENSRNVSYASGSNKGIHQGIEPGSQFLPNTSVEFWPVRVSLECKYSGVSQTMIVLGLKVEQWFLFFGWVEIASIGDEYSFDEKFYADAPAGWIGGDDMKYRIAFLPTVSAIDLKQKLIDKYNLDYFVTTDDAHPKEWYINMGYIPFDDVYSTNVNDYHVSGINVKDCFEQNEVMYDNMYLQNRTINNVRDLEASEMIVAGKDVTPDDFDKTIDVNNFVIGDNGDVTFTAGQTIRLEPGFIAEPGSHFIANIDNSLKTDLNKGFIEPPVITGNRYANIQKKYFAKNISKDDLIRWHLTGENAEITSAGFGFEVPENLDYGQYTLYCTKTNNYGTVTNSKVIVVLSDKKRKITKQFVNPVVLSAVNNNDSQQNEEELKINIFPNPNNGSFTVQSDLQIDRQNVTILGVLGNELHFDSYESNEGLKIKLDNNYKGIVLVKVMIGEINTTSKVIIQ